MWPHYFQGKPRLEEVGGSCQHEVGVPASQCTE